jgi:hypothetical protein
VRRYDAGHREGALSLSAFREMASLSPDEQRAVLAGGAMTRGQVKRARVKVAASKTAERAIESEDDIGRALDAAREIGARARFLVAWLKTARPLDAADVNTVLGQHKEHLAALTA